MKLIELSKNGKVNKGKYFAMVDDSDYDWLNQWNWSFQKGRYTNYATRYSYINGKKINIRMHRQILGITDIKIYGDHKDFNGLNNQRSNIRISTHAENRHNSRKIKEKSSKYIGVGFCKRKNRIKRWKALIYDSTKMGYKRIFLGFFLTEIEAALAYDKKAKEMYGEFANLNFNI